MKYQKGFIVVTALVIAACLSLMIAAFSLSVVLRNQVAIRYINSVKAYYLAAAGAQYARNYIWGWYGYQQQEPPAADFSITDAGDHITISYEKINNVLRIKSTAVLNNVSRTLVCEEDDNDYATTPVWYYWYESYMTPAIRWD